MASSYTIDEHDEALIDGLIESGRYKSASDVVRAGLRLVEQREQYHEAKLMELRAEIQKGINSGPAEDVGDMFARIKAEGREWLTAKNAK